MSVIVDPLFCIALVRGEPPVLSKLCASCVLLQPDRNMSVLISQCDKNLRENLLFIWMYTHIIV